MWASQLRTAQPEQPLAEIMISEVICIGIRADQGSRRSCVTMVSGLAVVDEEGRLAGILVPMRCSTSRSEEATEDIYRQVRSDR